MTVTYKNFIYNAERGFIFAYVPKVACTNWKALLRYMAGHEDWLDNKFAHDKKKGGLHYLELDGPDNALLMRPDISKYAMVRNPYSRVLSAYLNKIECRLPVQPETENEDHFHNVVRDVDTYRRDVLDVARFPDITLEVFLRWLKGSDSWFVNDEHWAPQVTLLHLPEVKFDIVGRFENLSEDAPRILRAMGCEQDFPSQKDVNFAPTGAQSKVQRYFDVTCCTLVEELYAEDFVTLEYTPLEVNS
ncbi:MAG: sulfotransferase family protein [Gammaproteobacteria bacterium]|nr:sulfotransferase family protein [Gammaproteobacteria bacterium]